MKVRFWGVRGSIPTPGPGTLRYGGNTPCVEVRCGDALLILDAGSGIRELGNELMRRGNPIRAHLLITHSHWDHVQGFPFFVPAYVPGTTLHLYGCQGSTRSLEEVLAGQMELTYFPVALREIGASIEFHQVDEGSFAIEDVRVRAMYANHPGLCLVYRLEWGGASVAYLSDTEANDRLATPAEEERPADLVGVEEGVDSRLVRFAAGADLLIADCPYTTEEYRQRRGWGHSSVDDMVQVALRAGVRRLALFHHDPSHNDEAIDALVEHARALLHEAGAPIDCFGAREGLELDLAR